MNYHSLDRPVRHLSVGPQRSRWLIVATVAALLAAAGIAALLLWPASRAQEERAARAERAVQSASPQLDLKLPPPDLLRPLTPEEAVLENEKRPFTANSGAPAKPFTLRADAISRFRAIDCLTQAVYYEAASEGLEGGRAVAQVVLNRVRHPAYPNSVCGVVYQGSTRTTGCQFTFTCDGSLLRPPSAYLWARARLIAQEALAGRVYAPVGLATHYHADYVLPYWADSLDKSVQIGRHIFYRLRGGLGSGRAFGQRYSGAEPTPPPAGTTAAVLDEALKVTQESAEPLLPVAEEATPRPLTDENPIAAPLQPESALAIDGSEGGLILDGGAPPPPSPSTKSKRPQQDSSCSDSGDRRSVEAIRANDFRTGKPQPGC